VIGVIRVKRETIDYDRRLRSLLRAAISDIGRDAWPSTKVPPAIAAGEGSA